MRTGLSKDLIARVLGAAPKYTIAELEEKFPPRTLPEGAMVTRFAPSPTGYMHIGGLYQALLDWKLAKQSGGVFMLRIEDTDTKREVVSAAEIIIDSLDRFGLTPGEGPSFDKNNSAHHIVVEPLEDMRTGKIYGDRHEVHEHGNYGPYFQSLRRDIYHSVVAELLEQGKAYPCFLSATEMEKIREEQKIQGLPTGIYGEWARDRDLMPEKIAARLDAGETPSIRLYSTGDRNQKIFCKDAVRGSIAFPQNDEDIVLIKSNDGLPTYHFAHLVDDHFMRTTHVVRGEEWLPSFPLHIQMFNMMGWTPPAYIHTSTLDTIDAETGKQRKLSKRKDPAANIAHFLTDGWPVTAVKNYLFNIMASGYEEEKAKKPETTIDNFELRVKKIPTSGALFDWKKLEWWSREFIATLPIRDLVASVTDWANRYGDEKEKSEVANQKYLHDILNIERDPSSLRPAAVGNSKRIRKDFVTWKQTLEEVEYFFDDQFEIGDWKLEIGKSNLVLSEFLATYNPADDKDAWWAKIVAIAEKLGIKNGDAAGALRVAVTGRINTPDLYSIMQVMDSDRRGRVRERIENLIK